MPAEANTVENAHREGLLVMPVFYTKSLHLNAGHLSTSNDVIDKMAIHYSRHCSVKGLARKRLLIHRLVRSTGSLKFTVMEVFESFGIALL